MEINDSEATVENFVKLERKIFAQLQTMRKMCRIMLETGNPEAGEAQRKLALIEKQYKTVVEMKDSLQKMGPFSGSN